MHMHISGTSACSWIIMRQLYRNLRRTNMCDRRDASQWPARLAMSNDCVIAQAYLNTVRTNIVLTNAAPLEPSNPGEPFARGQGRMRQPSGEAGSKG